MNKSQDIQPGTISLSVVFLIAGAILLLAGAACLSFFLTMNNSTAMVIGKVTDTYQGRAFTGSKRTVEQEFLIVNYTINGREYTKKTGIPVKIGTNHSTVSVFYYPRFPHFTWYNRKLNEGVSFGIAIILISLVVMSLTAYYIIRKAKKLQLDRRKKQSGKKNRQTASKQEHSFVRGAGE